MRPDGPNSLGGKKGTKASIRQGDPKIAYRSPDQIEEGAQCPLRNAKIDPIDESPNESSYLPLDVPLKKPATWSPHDKMRLLLIIGLIGLLLFCLVTESGATSQIIAIVALICGYLFGRHDSTGKST